MPSEITPIIEEIHRPLTSLEVFELFKDESYSFFLDSGINPFGLGRWSFMGSDPFLVFKSKGENIEIAKGGESYKLKGNPFDALKGLIAPYKLDNKSFHPAFLGGGVGYFSYDLCHFIEQLPSRGIDDLSLPDCYFAFYDIVLAFDHMKNKAYLASSGFPEIEKARARQRARARLEEVKHRLTYILPQAETENLPIRGELNLCSNFSREDYLNAVKRAKEYIARGDIYQVNLSQRFSTDSCLPPFELYKRLRKINPAPFAAFLKFEDLTFISASPERFLRLRNGIVETRPMKGTRPRGKDSQEDRRLKQELMQSKKDRAELVMIVDLERNDLGRVCEYGSVRVKELRTLESYATVFQTTATIVGRLEEGKDGIDLLKAAFPGGSITGAPKIRAMEIIDELEPTKRAVYTGSIGYISFSGDMDLSVIIRTLFMKQNKVYFQVGGGIVSDSEPEEEYAETLHKAKALIDSLSLKLEYEQAGLC